MTITELETILAARGLTAVREDYTRREWVLHPGLAETGPQAGG